MRSDCLGTTDSPGPVLVRLAILGLICSVIFGGATPPSAVASSASTAAALPVLGEAGWAPNGYGWGEIRPRRLYNGGVPSGLVQRIKWRSWGGQIASGRGRTALYKPEGGYYAEKGFIQLRAYGLGTCPGTDGKRTYTRLKARAQVRPDGPYGRWFRWSGMTDICGSFAD